METKKIINTLQISNILATIIDITDLIPTNTATSKKLENGLINYTIAQLNNNNYSISTAKYLATISGTNIKQVEKIYNSQSLTDFYIENGLAKLLIKSKLYNINYTTALKYQYEIDKLICNKYKAFKELENIEALKQVEAILLE